MMNDVKRLWFYSFRIISVMFISIYCHSAFADMPPAPDNANFDKGAVMAGLFDLFKEFMSYAIPGVMGAGVIIFMWASAISFMHARRTKEWGEFGMVFGVGAMLVVSLFILGNFAMKYFGGSPSA